MGFSSPKHKAFASSRAPPVSSQNRESGRRYAEAIVSMREATCRTGQTSLLSEPKWFSSEKLLGRKLFTADKQARSDPPSHSSAPRKVRCFSPDSKMSSHSEIRASEHLVVDGSQLSQPSDAVASATPNAASPLPLAGEDAVDSTNNPASVGGIVVGWMNRLRGRNSSSVGERGTDESSQVADGDVDGSGETPPSCQSSRLETAKGEICGQATNHDFLGAGYGGILSLSQQQHHPPAPVALHHTSTRGARRPSSWVNPPLLRAPFVRRCSLCSSSAHALPFAAITPP